MERYQTTEYEGIRKWMNEALNTTLIELAVVFQIIMWEEDMIPEADRSIVKQMVDIMEKINDGLER